MSETVPHQTELQFIGSSIFTALQAFLQQFKLGCVLFRNNMRMVFQELALAVGNGCHQFLVWFFPVKQTLRNWGRKRDPVVFQTGSGVL